MEHWKGALPDGSMIEVCYEKLVADQEGESRRLLSFLQLPWDAAVLRFFEARAGSVVRTASIAQVRKPIYSSSVGRCRVFERELQPLQEALGPLLRGTDDDGGGGGGGDAAC